MSGVTDEMRERLRRNVRTLAHPETPWSDEQVDALLHGILPLIRKQALEDAAKRAEAAVYQSYSPHDHPKKIAAAIREME